MTTTDKHIIDAYAGLFEGLSAINKIELIERLTKSLKSSAAKTAKNSFYKSFGAFESDKTAEEIITEIKAARKFRNKDFSF
jgi:hypothetical protein